MKAKPSVIRVLVVDDHFMVRRGLLVALRSEADIRVVAEASDSNEMLVGYREHRPDIVLLDWRLPGRNGSEATALLISEFPDARVLILSAMEGEEYARTALAAGAIGFALKSADREEIIHAIRETFAGRRFLPASLARKLDQQQCQLQVTAREREVLSRVAEGQTNKEIADHLGIAEATVKVFMARIFNKLDAKDRAHAVLLAMKRGILDV